MVELDTYLRLQTVLSHLLVVLLVNASTHVNGRFHMQVLKPNAENFPVIPTARSYGRSVVSTIMSNDRVSRKEHSDAA
jgi:hypothetical protein